MPRERSNCSATVVEPRKLVEVISLTAAMRVNWRSSGVATAEAMVSGLAPGRPVETLMVGKSTWSSCATGRSWVHEAAASANDMGLQAVSYDTPIDRAA